MHTMNPTPLLTIAVDFVHVFGRNSDDAALLNYLGIFSNDGFDDLKIFHGDLYTVNTFLYPQY
jgi:hypothetical protein